MSLENFDECLLETLNWEGGWADHPMDPGGATMKGVTLATYSSFLGRPATKDELLKIPMSDLEAIYKRRYWDAVAGDELPVGVDLAVFDFAVNSGPVRAARHLQALLHENMDGRIGPKTLDSLDAYIHRNGAEQLIVAYSSSRLSFLKNLSGWKTFGRGWERRVFGIEKQSRSMLQYIGV